MVRGQLLHGNPRLRWCYMETVCLVTWQNNQPSVNVSLQNSISVQWVWIKNRAEKSLNYLGYNLYSWVKSKLIEKLVEQVRLQIKNEHKNSNLWKNIIFLWSLYVSTWIFPAWKHQYVPRFSLYLLQNLKVLWNVKNVAG